MRGMQLYCALALLSLCAGFRVRTGSRRISGEAGRSTRVWEREGQREEEVRSSLKEARETYSGVFGDGAAPDDQFMNSLKSKRSYLSIVVERLVQSLDDEQVAKRMKQAVKTSSVTSSNTRRERIVVLGSGWGAHSFLKTVDAERYEVVVVSPRNYFLFTPMLAASAVGTVEFRSICEPIRNANVMADYLEATAVAIDAANKTVACQSVKCVGTSCDIVDFELSYDFLLVAVGATTNTFGIKGVREHCLFLKQIEDAANLRTAISYCFERANVPGLSEQERRNALSFVIVGAGPTGVEFTSELRDFIESEGRRYFKRLLKYVSIQLIEAGDAVLPVFDKSLQAEALRKLQNRKTTLVAEGLIEREMTTVRLKAGVAEITDSSVRLTSGEEIAYGFCVWAAGNGPVPVVLDLAQRVPAQQALQQQARGRLAIDSWQRVLGADGVLSIGDCAFNPELPLPATAQVASQQGSYLGRLLSKGFNLRAASVPFKDTRIDYPENIAPSERISVGGLGVVKEVPITLVTSTVANEDNTTIETEPAVESVVFAKPFQFLNLGILAYIGASEALAQVSVAEKQVLGSGPVGFLLWRGIYWSKQVSWRNRLLVGVDWLKARLFGRDIGSI